MRKSFVAVGLAVLGVLTIACSGATTPTNGPGVGSTDAGNGEHAIVFEVTGDGVSTANNISYGIGGNLSQANGAALPWKKEASAPGSFLLLSLTAQSGGKSGAISCKITVDGEVLVQNSSTGQYAVVTCSGTK